MHEIYAVSKPNRQTHSTVNILKNIQNISQPELP